MEIIEYNADYIKQVKNLLVELQEHIVAIDNWFLNILTSDYREKYFEKTMQKRPLFI